MMSLKKNWKKANKMWTVLKFDKKRISLLKNDFTQKLGEDFKIYNPKIRLQKFKNNKIINKEVSLLGDYMFCFHKSFSNKKIIDSLKFSKGLKYFLDGFYQSQMDLENFINKCRDFENKDGYLTPEFFNIEVNKKYKFSSGPFTDKIFKILKLQKNRIKISIGKIETTVKQKDFLFTPI